jgi:hypothetical protein
MQNIKTKYLKDVKETIVATEALIMGGSLTPTEYANQCGFLNGLKHCVNTFTELYVQHISTEEETD